MNENIIGKQIYYLRSKFGYTQEDLATKIGVSKQTVSNWETGLKTPRMGAIQKLANLFNVKKSFIIEGIENTSDEIVDIYEQLNHKRKNEVLDFARFKLYEQNKDIKNKITSIDQSDNESYTLAAHSSDPDKKYTEDDVKNIKSALAKARKKHEDKNK